MKYLSELDIELKIVIAILLFVIVLFVRLVAMATKEQERWEAFAVDHDCQVVSHEKGGTGIGYNYAAKGGVVMVTEPDITGYLCNDGITYYR